MVQPWKDIARIKESCHGVFIAGSPSHPGSFHVPEDIPPYPSLGVSCFPQLIDCHLYFSHPLLGSYRHVKLFRLQSFNLSVPPRHWLPLLHCISSQRLSGSRLLVFFLALSPPLFLSSLDPMTLTSAVYQSPPGPLVSHTTPRTW